MSAEFFNAGERLLSATANGLYQGILVALLAGLALRFLVRTNAATRHAVWFGVLLFVAALIPVHFLLSLPSRPAIPVPASAPAELSAAALVPATSEDGHMDDAAPSDPSPVDSGAGSISGPLLPGSGLRDESPRTNSLRLPHSVCLALISAWALLAGIRGGMVLWRIHKIRRFKATSIAPTPRLETLFDALRPSPATGRQARLRISNTHRTAVVLGFLHPVVLLPAEMDQDADGSEVEHVLRHELAHVVRRDDWSNLAQQTIQAALFFHPVVWWISARLSLEREIACDDHVLEASGRPRAYALTLANIASRLRQCRATLAPGVSNNNSQLQQRITMILNTQRDRSPRLAGSRLGIFTIATAMLALLAIGAGPRLVLAETPEPTLLPDLSGPDSGPRPKAVAPDLAEPSAPVTSAPKAPVAFISADAPSVPEPPVEPAAPAAAPAPPFPPTANSLPSYKKRHEMTVEERLDRIERILDRLDARGEQRGPRHVDGLSMSKGQPQPGALGQLSMNIDVAAKIAAERAERAAEEMQRAVEAGQRAAEQAARKMESLRQYDFQYKFEGSDKELEALRDARQTLEGQLKNIERQIHRLEQDQKSPATGTSHQGEENHKATPAPAPETQN